MKFSKEIEAFIKAFVKDLNERNVAVFVGAGMSKAVGFVDWPGLLADIADELGLKIDKESGDLISLAQYHVNEKQGKAGLTRKILEEFSDQAESSENHKIFARLPITTFWTTNYDTLIEDTLKAAYKVADVKHQIKQLSSTRPKRDVVVYKMHGDVHHAADAVLTKEQYELYYKSHEHFITALSGDLISKTFLFIGFSFSDPNLDYVLSRLNIQFGSDNRQHYCFFKKEERLGGDDEETFEYKKRKQNLRIGDLKRYKIQALLVDDYPQITEVLEEIERRFRKQTVFISGSAEEYGTIGRDAAQKFIHSLSKKIVSNHFRIINGFGWGVGSAVINGALEAIYEKPEKFSEEQLVIKPFPQFESGEKNLKELWEEYRQRMIAQAGIAIFIFGNKKDLGGEIIDAPGVMREFEIAIQHGVIPIPIGATGDMTKQIYEFIAKDPGNYYSGMNEIFPILEKMSKAVTDIDDVIPEVIKILKLIN